jgi:hypothetical protein
MNDRRSLTSPSFAMAAHPEANSEGKIFAMPQDANTAAARTELPNTAADEIRQRAIALGYDPDRAVWRLAYGSFVSLERRYAFVETPKAACTTLKHLVAKLENAEPDLSSLRRYRETRRYMLIHDRHLLRVPSILEVGDSIRSAIIDPHPDWFVFAIVRNPFSRVVSVFENKVRLGEPGYSHLEQRYGDRGPFTDVADAFRAFVAEIVGCPNEMSADTHLPPQVDMLMPGLVAYTRIFYMERLDELYIAFRQHLARLGQAVDLQPERLNASLPHANWRCYYDEASAATVARIYAEDFRTFGYDPKEWRPTEGTPPMVPESESIRQWRREVVERNAVIDDLYEQGRLVP